MTQVIMQTWEKALKFQFGPKLETWGRFGSQVSDVLKTVAQRAYATLSVSKEEEIRAWWRVQQEEKRVFWTRRGYSDAQHGNDGYPHHGTCYCAWCKAYWAGHVRFQHGEAQEVTAYQVDLSPLGFLSPPPRKEVVTRAVKSLAQTKKETKSKDVVIQTHPAMFSTVNSFPTLGMGKNIFSEEQRIDNVSSETSKSLQPQGEWQLPQEKKVKPVVKKKERKGAVVQRLKAVKGTGKTLKKKKLSSAVKRRPKSSKMLLSA